MEVNEKYTPIIGLEIHVELNTKSKMFCQCPADYFGADPNSHTCPVCLGMPGALPVPNKEAIRRTILLGKALNCKINNRFKFDRKHYFYPDLAKGYQISQYDEPIAYEGRVEIQTENDTKSFGITRVHLEEDTGKLTHKADKSYVDFNRGGVPLVEIVTEPNFHDGEDVKNFLEELQCIVRSIEIADADMEKGDMRLEPNISVQLTSKLPDLPAYKVEVKNINSFKFVQKSIEFEVERQIEILETGELPPQETRGWDTNSGTTISQRIKEDAADYRYFPDPDIPVFNYTDAHISEIAETMPELPLERLRRFMDLGLKYADAFFLSRDNDTSRYYDDLLTSYEEVEKTSVDEEVVQDIANYYVNKKVADTLEPAEFIKKYLELSAPTETDADKLGEVIEEVLGQNSKAIEDYTSGSNPNAIMFLVGQVMKGMQGKADANLVKEELAKRLENR